MAEPATARRARMDAALGARRPQRRNLLRRVRYQVPMMTADAATGGYAAELTVAIAEQSPRSAAGRPGASPPDAASRRSPLFLTLD